jgi:hypothetical protein
VALPIANTFRLCKEAIGIFSAFVRRTSRKAVGGASYEVEGRFANRAAALDKEI